ncbi:Protein transport protein sec20 [Recurvomyces mirabilis]|nr:Protein transport protein sec20 [Recurvomyces mirabilis]
MSLASLTTQLNQLTETLKQTNTLITNLSKLSFQPGSEPLDAENTVRIELAQDIHDSLKQLEEDFDLLKQESDDLSTISASHKRRDSARDTERLRFSAQVARTGEDLRHSHSKFRKAQLSAKRASETAKQKERELVFASLQTVPEQNGISSDNNNTDSPSGRGTPDLFSARSRRAQQKQVSKDDQLLTATTDVTAALRRTHNLLSTELSRSRFAQETFDQSTAALSELGEKYVDLGGVLEKSRDLLGTLLRSQKSDTWYLETAFYLLVATIGWLFFRRILYGPFFKLPAFVWRWVVFAVRWIVVKPLWLFLTGTGIITTSRAAASTALTQTSTRRPLIVQRSATAGPPSLAMSDREALASGRGVPAGAGGMGAKVGKDEETERRVSEQIAALHERSEREARGEGEEVVRRGDGTVLRERGEDEPKNPRKKNFEADVEDAKFEEQQQQQQQKQRVKRDEL